jgi:hypothetical protein
VLDDGTLLAELDDNNSNLNISLVKLEMIDRAGVDAATLPMPIIGALGLKLPKGHASLPLKGGLEE